MDWPERGAVAAICLVGGASLLRTYAQASTSERARWRVLATYNNAYLPLFMRLSFVLAPLYATAIISFGLLAVLPRLWAAWLSILPFACLLAAFVLSYRVPQPLAPSWMRSETMSGHVLNATPDRVDWLMLWVVVPVMVAGLLALPVLIVVFHGAG